MNPSVAVARARREAGLSQMALAERAGTSQATLSAYENGRKEPSVATLARLLAATGSRLTVASGKRPIVEPSRGQIAKTARTLSDVLDLAAALPTRHQPDLRYPRLPAP